MGTLSKDPSVQGHPCWNHFTLVVGAASTKTTPPQRSVFTDTTGGHYWEGRGNHCNCPVHLITWWSHPSQSSTGCDEIRFFNGEWGDSMVTLLLLFALNAQLLKACGQANAGGKTQLAQLRDCEPFCCASEFFFWTLICGVHLLYCPCRVPIKKGCRELDPQAFVR